MVELWLPYGDTEVPVRIPDGNLLASVLPAESKVVGDLQTEISETLRKPREGKRFDQILDRKDKVTIVIEDPKGLLPIRSLLTPVLSELESSGIRRENISALVAWTDWGSIDITKIRRRIREQVPEDIEVLLHNPDTSRTVKLEPTSLGTNLEINEIYVKSDIRMVLGEVRFDNLVGYTGLGSAIVPGLASSQTISECHSLALEGGCGRGLVEKNPLSQDIIEASRIAGIDFQVSVVLGDKNEVVGVFGGEPESTFSEAVQLVDRIWKRPIEELADIIVISAGGAPFDQYFYWAVDSIDAATLAIQENGAIVMAAECRRGPGNRELQKYIQRYRRKKDILRAIKRETTPAGYKSLRLREALERHRITLVSAMPDFYSRKIFGLGTTKTVNDAVVSTLRRQGSDSKILVIPLGITTTPSYSSV